MRLTGLLFPANALAPDWGRARPDSMINGPAPPRMVAGSFRRLVRIFRRVAFQFS
jgi:hypothetical protein